MISKGTWEITVERQNVKSCLERSFDLKGYQHSVSGGF